MDLKKSTFLPPISLCILGIRIILGGLFIYSGWVKIADPAGFAQTIANYQLIPVIWGNWLALFLPWLELVCGLCLITGWMQGASALIVAMMLIVFMVAIGISMYRGIDINCGCFGNGEAPTGNLYMDLIRDAVLLSMAAFVAFMAVTKDRPKPATE